MRLLGGSRTGRSLPGAAQGLLSLDGVLHTTPLTLLALSRRLVGSAVTNARRSLEEIAGAIDDRGALLQHLDDGVEAGDLLRLTRAACLQLLGTKSTGRLAYIAREGMPDIVPVNYALDGDDLLIRSGPGPKLQAAERREHVAFEVDDIDEQTHTGWSVVVSGIAERLAWEDCARRGLPEPWATGSRRHAILITPQRIEGRQLL
jgi:hypothetical protein